MKKKNKLQIYLLLNKISNSWILLEGKVIWKFPCITALGNIALRHDSKHI